MKSFKLPLAAGIATLFVFYACVKNGTPQPPVHDTVTIHKTDTLRIPVVPDTPNLKIGLLVYLPFNGSMADSSGNGNPTIAVGGAALSSDAHGYANSALSGTGAGQRVIVTNNGSIKFDTAFSLSVDFMTRSYALQDIVSMVQPANGQGVSFGTGMLAGTNNFNFAVMDSSGTCSDEIHPGINCDVDSTNTSIQPENWYNIITTFRKGTLQVFINGKLVSTKTGTNYSAPICPSAKLIVGGWWDGDPVSIDGKLDEVRLYNRVLSAKEIAWLSRNFQPSSTKLIPGVKTR